MIWQLKISLCEQKKIVEWYERHEISTAIEENPWPVTGVNPTAQIHTKIWSQNNNSNAIDNSSNKSSRKPCNKRNRDLECGSQNPIQLCWIYRYFLQSWWKKTAVKMSKDLVQQSVATGVHLKMSHAPHTYRRRNLFSAQCCHLLCSPQWPITTPIIPALNAPYNITSVKSMYILSHQRHLCLAGKSRAHHSGIFIIWRRKQWRPSPQTAITFSMSSGCWPPVG